VSSGPPPTGGIGYGPSTGRAKEATVKRTGIGGIAGVVLLACVLAVPAAEASEVAASTSCSMSAKLTFKPALIQGVNTFEFIDMKVRLRDCSGGGVISADGYGGAAGTLTCDSGRVAGKPSMKMQVFWNTGSDSGMNGTFNFQRSRLHGRVTGERFKGERFDLAGFALRRLDGDCATTPLEHATLTGTLSL
jgi:hypothetical protein